MRIKTHLRSLIKPVAVHVAAKLGPQSIYYGTPKLWVIMYHRILPKSDPRYKNEEPGMVVTPETFALHLKTLQRRFAIMRLTDWLEQKQNGANLPKRACAITFDDGWLDNYEFAFPLIQKYQVPITLFIVEGMIGTEKTFWPNRLSSILDQVLTLNLETLKTNFNFIGEYNLNRLLNINGQREKLAFLISILKHESDSYIDSKLKHLEKQLDISPAKSPSLLNWEQLKEMDDSRLVDIGCHTHSHLRLHQELADEVLERELITSKLNIENKLNKSVELFCYPNGDFNEHTYALVKENYSAAVTTKRGINSYSQDNSALMRIGVHEDISNKVSTFQARLSGWL